MRQFVVPQFIDVEDKIIGPITVRQFIILIIAGMFMFIEFKLSDMALFILLAILTAIFFGIFAFVKINSMPFHYFVLNFIQTLKRPKLRIWSRDINPIIKVEHDDQSSPTSTVKPKLRPLITNSHLSDLALLIDTGGVYQPENLEKDYSFNS